jgi:hypothetical protein
LVQSSTRGTARGRFAGFSVRPSCLKILGGSLARACALLFAVARAEGAQDRGEMKGRCEPRENIERRASKKIRAAF